MNNLITSECNNWRVEETTTPRIFILRFGIGEKNYHRRMKLRGVEEANDILNSLKCLVNGGISDNRKATAIYNSLGIAKYHKEKEYSDLLDLCDTINESNELRIKELEAEVFRLKSHIAYLQGQVEKQDIDSSINEIYPGELEHFLLQAAKQVRCQWEIGTNHKRRGVDVLDEYINTKEESDYADYIYQELFSAFTSNLNIEQIKSRLSKINIECERGNNNHYHIYFKSHPEYLGVVPSTPSDFKSYKNGIKKFIQVVFK